MSKQCLKPFWNYYGGKWRAAPKYPKPKQDTIIEPFAGAAGYSLRYPERQVVLVEKYHVIAETLESPILRSAWAMQLGVWTATHARGGFRWHVSGDIGLRGGGKIESMAGLGVPHWVADDGQILVRICEVSDAYELRMRAIWRPAP